VSGAEEVVSTGIPLTRASEILTELAGREQHAMQTLVGIRTD
jgi:hypothetical protein